MKICTKCDAEKDESEFYKRKNGHYRLECKVCRIKCNKQYECNNKDHILDRKKDYYQEHKKERNDYNKQYNKIRMQEDPLFKFIRNTRCLMNQSFKNGGWEKDSTTQELLGCTFEEFFDHLGPIPDGDIDKDHICPFAQAKTQEEAEKLCHYSNFRWLTAEENGSKQDSWTPEGEKMCRKLLEREWIL